MLKSKYYIHNVISMILFIIFSVVVDLIFKNFSYLELKECLTFLSYLVYDLLFCYMKYLIDKKYHSYWNILFFYGLYYFIINAIGFLIIVIKDPDNNNIFKFIRVVNKNIFILSFLFKVIFSEFFKMLLIFLILNYFSLNHVLISNALKNIIVNIYNCVSRFNIYKNNLFFLIPAFFLVLSLLFYLEILEFNFCNLNKNTKRNIMLREDDEMLTKNTRMSEIEVDNDLIVKNPTTTTKRDLELSILIDNSDEKDNNNDNTN